MPVRNDPLVAGEIYHIVNRGVASMPIFINYRHYQRALETISYYQHKNSPLRYSYFSRQIQSAKTESILKRNEDKEYSVEIICYCLMPNHIHFLLKQLTDNGISEFMGKFSNSYTRYFNVKNKRIGPIFQGPFKSVRVETEQQLLHVSRYIHLNPYSSGIIKSIKEIQQYPYSSLSEYLGKTNYSYCQKEIVLNYFKKPGSYLDFIYGHAESQRELAKIKHLLLENLETD